MSTRRNRSVRVSVSRAISTGFSDWDPLSYSAEIATAGMICAVLMLMVIALP